MSPKFPVLGGISIPLKLGIIKQTGIMPTSKELLVAAQNEQLQTVAKNRVAVLTGLAELKEFGGEDDYVASLLAIVQNYTDGIVLTQVREVLPNSEILDKAIKTLVDKKEITNDAVGKRKQMLKLAMKPAADAEEVNAA